MESINKLRNKWGVGVIQFWLIITTFALGGSLSGYLNKKVLNLVFEEKNAAYWVFYPIVLTILWPFSVILMSFVTGQFLFFKGYLGRVLGRLFGGAVKSENKKVAPATTVSPIHIAIFASGAGSNAKKIIEHFENTDKNRTPIKVSLIVCNVPSAGVLGIAKEKGIPTLLINKVEFNETGYVESLRNADIHFIVLAGFLWKVPEVLVNAFPKGIINIHPALLPNYGGKGMYGSRVHEAIIAAGETESGITIHWVDAHYDEGDIIFQAKCIIESGDTPEILANKIHALEHAHFAPTIEKLLLG